MENVKVKHQEDEEVNVASPVASPRRTRSMRKYQTKSEVQVNLKGIIGCIHPEIKKHGDIYKQVKKKLEEDRVGECRTWADTVASKDFRGWLKVSNKDTPPDLVTFAAALATHRGLSNSISDLFSVAVRDRGLVDWMLGELVSKTAEKKQKKEAKREQATAQRANSPNQQVKQTEKPAVQSVLPSIEDQPPKTRSNLLATPVSTAASAPPNVKFESPRDADTDAQEPSPKRQKMHQEIPWVRKATCDAGTQMEKGPFDDLAAAALEKIPAIVSEAVFGTLPLALREVLPTELREMVRIAMAEEFEQQRQIAQAFRHQQVATQPIPSTLRQQPRQTYRSPVRQQSFAPDAVKRGHEGQGTGNLMAYYGYQGGY